MGLSAMHPFIGFAEGADACLDVLDDGKGYPCLAATGVATDRAEFADAGQ